jgi:thiol-disulfide isomerase/thioredoxin
MRLALIRSLAIASAVASGASASGCASAPSQVTLHSSDRVVAIDELRGKVVVLNYWATWCQPCMREIPALVGIVSEMSDRVVLLAVNENDDFYGRAIVNRWLEKNPATFTPFIGYGNSTLRYKYPFRGLPTTYVIAPDGRIAAKFEGSLSETQARALIAKAQGTSGEPVADR